MILLRLQHENLVAVHHVALAHDPPYFVMEEVGGRTLRHVMLSLALSGETAALHEIHAVVRQILEGLREAHDRKILHRDLKPGNILLSHDGGHIQVRLIDFGIARLRRADTDSGTTVGRVVGTYAYIAPELLTGERDASPQSDLFSVGCLLFELLTLRRPWYVDAKGVPLRYGISVGDQFEAMLERVVRGVRPSVTDWRPDAAGFAPVVEALLAPWPSDRPRDCAEVLTLLNEPATVAATRPAAPVEKTSLSALVELARCPILGVEDDPIEGTATPEPGPIIALAPMMPAPPPPRGRNLAFVVFLLSMIAVVGVVAFVATDRGPPPRAPQPAVEVRTTEVRAVARPKAPEASADAGAALPEPSRTPHRRAAAKRKTTKTPPAVQPSVEKRPLLRALERLEDDRSNYALARSILARVERRAGQLEDDGLGRRIVQNAQQSIMLGDVEGLRAAVEALLAAERK